MLNYKNKTFFDYGKKILREYDNDFDQLKALRKFWGLTISQGMRNKVVKK